MTTNSSMKRSQKDCPLRCAIDCRANLRGGECKAPLVDAEAPPKAETIMQYNLDVSKELGARALSEVYAFEKDYFDGAHALFIILRNKGLLK